MNTGALRLWHQLDFDLNPGTSVGRDPHLVYNSATVNPRPVIEAVIPVPPPPNGNALLELTINGVTTTVERSAPEGMSGPWVVAIQPDAALAEGAYEWTLTVTARDANDNAVAGPWTATGLAQVVDNTTSAFGAGWNLDLDWRLKEDRLGDELRGVLLVYGSGESRYFPAGVFGFLSPDGEFGTLQETPTGYEYTSEFGEAWAFAVSGGVGRLATITDRNGLATAFGHAPDGRLASVSTVDGNVVAIQSEGYAGGAFLHLSESGGRDVTIDLPTAAASRNVASITDTDATGTLSTRAFTYAPASGLVTGEVWGQQVTRYGYNGADLLNAFEYGPNAGFGSQYQVDAAAAWGLGEIPLLSPVTAPFVGALKDPRTNATRYAVDPLGRTGKATFADGTFTAAARDADGQVVSLTDERGHTTGYGYNANGHLSRVNLPDGGGASFVRDAFGSVLEARDAYGAVTAYEYDEHGNVTKVTDALQNVTQYQYHSGAFVGLLYEVTDALGRTTSYSYGANRRLWRSYDADTYETKYAYDAAGNLKAVTDPLGRVTTTVFDGLNRLTSRTDVLGGQSTWSYNAVGQVLTAQAPEGLPTKYEYDSRGLLDAVTEGVGSAELQSTTLYRYDAAGNLALVLAPRLDLVSALLGVGGPWWTATTYDYDSRNRVIRQTEGAAYQEGGNSYDGALAHTTRYGYDKAGNLAWAEYAQKYDAALGGPSSGPLFHDSFDYDPVGRVERSTSGEQGFWSTSSPGTWVVEQAGRTNRTWYDLNGNVQLERAPDGTLTYHHYDELNRLVWTREAISTPVSRFTEMDYDKVGDVAWVKDGLGNKTTFGYDNLDRRTRVTEAAGTSVERTFLTQYDAVGRTTWEYEPLIYGAQVYKAASGDQPLTHVGTHSEYDDVNRTVTVTRAANVAPGSTPSGRAAFAHIQPRTVTSYDTAGRVTLVGEYADAETARFTRFKYDGLGRQTGVYEDWAPVPGGEVYGRATTWLHDPAGRVVRETRAGVPSNASGVPARQSVSTTYDYDALGRLRATTDGVQPLVENAPAGYAYDPGVAPTTGYEYDARDNLTQLTDPNGNVTQFTYTRFDEVEETREGGVVLPLVGATGFLRTSKAWYDDRGRVIYLQQDRFTAGQVGSGDPTVTTRYEYDALGRQTAVTEAWGTDLARTTRSEYDAADRLVRVVEPVPIASGLTGALGALFPLINRQTVFKYDELGRQTSVTTAAGAIGSSLMSTRGYDAADNVIWEATPRKYDYTPTPPTVFGLAVPTALPSADAVVTLHTYDALDRRTSTTVAANASAADLGHAPPVARWTYDAYGRVRVEEHAASTVPNFRHAVRYTYDDLDQVTKVEEGVTPATRTDPVSEFTGLRSETRGYDGAGNLVTHVTGEVSPALLLMFGTDSPSHPITTRYEYDALGRLRVQREVQQDKAGEQNEIDRVTRTSYDANGNVTVVSVHSSTFDPNAADKNAAWLAATRDTKFGYDRLDRRTTVIQGYDPGAVAGANQQNLSGLLPADQQYNAVTTAYQYDAAGRVTRVSDPRGVVSTNSYDLLGRLRSTVGGAELPAGMAQSAAGQNFIATQTIYAYDSGDRLTGVAVLDISAPAQAPQWTWTTFGYDAYDRQTSSTEGLKSTDHPFDAKVVLTASPVTRRSEVVYDAAGNKRQVAIGLADASQKVEGRAYALEQRAVYDYDALGRVTAVWQARPGESFTTLDAAVAADALRPYTKYGYDALNNVSSTTTNISEPGKSAVRVDSYTYDVFNRLGTVRQASNAATDSRTTRAWYDGADNKIRVIDGNGVQTDYEYDGLNLLTVEKVRSNLHPGEPDQDQYLWTTTTYSRNVWGEVKTLTTPSTQSFYNYDRLGRQTAKVYGDVVGSIDGINGAL